MLNLFSYFRSRRRSGSGVTDIHSQQQQQQLQLQENNNSSSRDAKKPQEGLGPDEMWAPGALGHHRELPVDVPDTLLQKAYPNKVKHRSSYCRNGLQHCPRSASDLNLSLNLKNETLKTRTIANERARLVSNHDVIDAAARTISVHNGLQPSMLKIELNIEDEEKMKATRKNLVLDKYRDSPIATGSPDLKSTFKAFEVYANVDEGGQKESSVDIEDDYPFAKEDYPTMLKTCSDDSASPRSSSGRSDSTAPLDTSLMLRHSKSHKDSPTYDVRRIDLGSPCRSVVPDIKVAPLFGRTTSFDNPAYGLTDLQDLQGLLRSDEMSDLTRLIDEQSPIPRTPQEQDKVSPIRVKDQQTELSQTEPVSKSGKSPTKRRTNDERAKLKAKTRSLDIEELIRAGSTDDLLGIELSNLSSSSRQRPKKKRHQQISSGYSTLRSEASGDLEHNAERSFLVVGRKPYREVAVDCPPDFVPVTKCHPIYPPPNKIPGNSKHNTLEPKRDRASVINEESSCVATTTTTMTTTTTTFVASPRLSPNDNSFTTLSSTTDGSAKETVVARSVDHKHSLKKVRSKVKSLICDSLQSILHHEHGDLLNAYSTQRFNAPTQSHSNDPVLRSFAITNTENPNELSRIRASFNERDGKFFQQQGIENPCFEDIYHSKRPVLRQGAENVSLESKERPLSSVLREVPKSRNSFLGENNKITSSLFPKVTGDSICLNFPSDSQDKMSSTEKLLDFKKETEFISDHPSEDYPMVSLLLKEDIAFFKVADNIHTKSSTIQETNQNSRNSLCELSSAKQRVTHRVFDTRFSDNFPRREKERRDLHCFDDSPKIQNQKNSKLSFEYEWHSKLNVPFMSHNNSVKFRLGWKSMSDLSNLIVDWSHLTIIKRSSSLPDFVSIVTSSRCTVKWNTVDHPIVLHDGLSDKRTRQNAPKPPMHTLKNRSFKSHVDALEQVNHNGLEV